MNDNLNFGIHFDLEKGLKDAQADWAKVEKEFTNKTIKIKVSVPKATTIDNLEAVTKRLKESGKILGIELLDHLIITSDGYLSLKEEGVL